MTTPFSGGCACGAIRYESAAKPMMMFFCHCRDCQRAGGGGYAAAVLVPADAFKLTRGSPKYFAAPSARGGTHTRGFCVESGSPVVGIIDPASPVVGVVAASLDDPTIFQPTMDIFIADVQPWDQLNPALAQFEQYPPSASPD